MLPRLHSTLLGAAAALALAPTGALADGGHGDLPTYQVGVGKQSIAISAQEIAAKNVFLGGFGIGGPTLGGQGPGLGDRYAKGNLGVGPSVRAFIVSDGKSTFAIADAELQGWFAETKDGPYGIMDVRRYIADKTGGAIPADHVVVQSDHTHGGPDLLGVWGGAPTEYRARVVKATEDAILQAWNNRRDGTLWYGRAPGVDPETGQRLLNNQFDYDPANKVMDSDVRVLQARDPHSGRPFATMLDFSAHADVLGSSNQMATGDWVQTTNPMLEKAFGGDAMTVVGTLGRTQPNRPGCADPKFADEGDSLCSLDTYSERVVNAAVKAADDAQPLTGKPEVVANSYLITDAASNPLLLGMLWGGAPLGLPVNRSIAPPFMAGNAIGTSTTSVRIGDVLLSAGPGEMYPQIPLKVRGTMEQIDPNGVRGYMTAGLADDQLGYLIAPLEAYPQPIWTSVLDSDFPNPDKLQALPANCAAALPSEDALNACNPGVSPIGNDNYFFNVSHTMAERVTCSLLRGAGEVFGEGTTARDAYDRCRAFANDAALPEGTDVTAADATKDVPAVPASIPPS